MYFMWNCILHLIFLISTTAELLKHPFRDSQSYPHHNLTWRTLTYRFCHIPKTAGTSFKTLMIKNGYPYPPWDEKCLETFWPIQDVKVDPGDEKNAGEKRKRMQVSNKFTYAFVRQPREHILSLFYMCKYAAPRTIRFPNSSTLPDTVPGSDMDTWLSNMLIGWNDPSAPVTPRAGSHPNPWSFNCYHPFNMQTRAFSPGCKQIHPFRPAQQTSVDMSRSIHNMYRTSFVGLTEHFHLSICILFDLAHQQRMFKSYCGDDTTPPSDEAMKVLQSRSSWGLPKHSVQSLSPDLIVKIDALSQEDVKLYAAARNRFFAYIPVFQNRTGVPLSRFGL